MTQIIKIIWFKAEITPDYRLMMMQQLEPFIINFCKSRNKWLKGMSRDDIAQELRNHLFKNLDKYHPEKSSLETWCNIVITRKWISLYRYVNAKKRTQK